MKEKTGWRSRLLRGCLLPLVLMIFLVPDAGADIYSWVDENGIFHASNRLEEVPPAYQGKIKVMASPSDPADSSAPADRTAAEYLIPFESSAGGIMLVDVLFNGHIRAKMVLDTGASVILISDVLAGRMRLGGEGDSRRRALLKTAGGEVEGRAVTIDRVEVGDAVRRSVPAAISPKKEVFEGFDGLLGLSFLGNFKMTIDYRNRLIVLKEH